MAAAGEKPMAVDTAPARVLLMGQMKEELKYRIRELDQLIRSNSSEVRIRCQHRLIEIITGTPHRRRNGHADPVSGRSSRPPSADTSIPHFRKHELLPPSLAHEETKAHPSLAQITPLLRFRHRRRRRRNQRTAKSR